MSGSPPVACVLAHPPAARHDRCQSCWAQISTLVGDRAAAEEAYVTAGDDDSFVCAACVASFRDRFRRTETENETKNEPETA